MYKVCPLLQVGIRARIHAHETCSSGLRVGDTWKYTAACAGPAFLPSQGDRPQAPINATIHSHRIQAGIHRHTSTVLGRSLRRFWSERSSCERGFSLCLSPSLSLSVSRTPPLASRHVSVSGEIVAAAAANHRRLSLQKSLPGIKLMFHWCYLADFSFT